MNAPRPSGELGRATLESKMKRDSPGPPATFVAGIGIPRSARNDNFQDLGDGLQSFAPLGLVGWPLLPTAYAVGCTLSPLRGYKLAVVFHHVVEILVLTHTLKALLHPKSYCLRGLHLDLRLPRAYAGFGGDGAC
jgi:hypothetical protein